MSTEINCVNGESESGADCGNGSIMLASKTSINNNNGITSTATPTATSKAQKSKKRRDQKTYDLSELFDKHQSSVGNWADAALENSFKFPLPPPQKPAPEPQPFVENEQRPYAEWDNRSRPRSQSRAGSQRPPSVGIEARASHSRHVNMAYIPDSPPFEVFVTNINYNSSEEEIYFFFGGEDSGVQEILWNEAQGPAAKRGTATVSFNSREALIAALQHDRLEAGGRILRVTLRQQRASPRSDYYGTYPGANDCGQYRSNSYAGISSMGSAYTSSLPPRPRGPPIPSNYHGGGYTNYDTYGGRPERHPPYYDNRRSDFGNRSLRYTTGTVSNTYQQHPRYNRPYVGRHSMYENSSSQYRGSNYDISNRGCVRTDSMASMPQTGTSHEEHHERRKLELQPRTKPIGAEEENMPTRKSSIFGEAKPVDTSEKERQAEERLRLEDEAFRRSNSSTRKLSSDYGYSRSSSYGKVTLMKSASHDGVHGMITKQNSVVDEPLLEENSTPDVPPHRHLPPPSPRLPPRPPPHVSSFSSVPSTPSLEPPTLQRQSFTTPTPGSASTMPPPPSPVTSNLMAATNRRPSPARSFRSRSKDIVVDSSADVHGGNAQQRSKHGYNRTFRRSSFRANTPAKQPVPSQGVETGHIGGGAASGNGDATSSVGPVMGRGGGGSRRGGRRRGGSAASRDKRRRASRDQRKTSTTSTGDEPQTIEQSAKRDEPPKEADPVKQEDDNKKEESMKKEEKPKTEDGKKESRSSKREKKKQMAKEMPKMEPKSVNFSSQNKFAALLETDE